MFIFLVNLCRVFPWDLMLNLLSLQFFKLFYREPSKIVAEIILKWLHLKKVHKIRHAKLSILNPRCSTSNFLINWSKDSSRNSCIGSFKNTFTNYSINFFKTPSTYSSRDSCENSCSDSFVYFCMYFPWNSFRFSSRDNIRDYSAFFRNSVISPEIISENFDKYFLGNFSWDYFILLHRRFLIQFF